MSTLTINIFDLKAERLLIDLVDMNLILIQNDNPFEEVLKLLRASSSSQDLSLEEIEEEVTGVRSERSEQLNF